MIALIDYKMGNLQSVANALTALGCAFEIASRPESLERSKGIIIPGVGAFKKGMENLKNAGFIEALNREVINRKKPILGICLGMQLFAKKSYEHGECDGLGWVDFDVKKITPKDKTFRVPHMGWNDLDVKKKDSILFNGSKDPKVVYFVHSYHLVPDERVNGQISSISYHGTEVTASIEKDNIFGTQFHPEKSQNFGLLILKNFLNLC